MIKKERQAEEQFVVKVYFVKRYCAAAKNGLKSILCTAQNIYNRMEVIMMNALGKQWEQEAQRMKDRSEKAIASWVQLEQSAWSELLKSEPANWAQTIQRQMGQRWALYQEQSQEQLARLGDMASQAWQETQSAMKSWESAVAGQPMKKAGSGKK